MRTLLVLDNMHLSGALWLVIAAGVLGVVTVMRLLLRPPSRNLGEMSGQWIAQHRAGQPRDSSR